jgi:hypothetical protein
VPQQLLPPPQRRERRPLQPPQSPLQLLYPLQPLHPLHPPLQRRLRREPKQRPLQPPLQTLGPQHDETPLQPDPATACSSPPNSDIPTSAKNTAMPKPNVRFIAVSSINADHLSNAN